MVTKKTAITDSNFIRYQEKIIKTLQHLFPHASVYLFGSRARSTNRETSDIDIAINTGNKLSKRQMRIAREALEDLNIPLSIDLVDMNNVQEELRTKIKNEGVVWIDYMNVTK